MLYYVIGMPVFAVCAVAYVIVKLSTALVKGLISGVENFITEDLHNFRYNVATWGNDGRYKKQDEALDELNTRMLSDEITVDEYLKMTEELRIKGLR